MDNEVDGTIEDRLEVNILGRNLGTASGWDGEPGENIWFYDFEPVDDIDLPKCTLSIDFTKGEIGAQDDEGLVQLPLDIVSFLNGVAK